MLPPRDKSGFYYKLREFINACKGEEAILVPSEQIIINQAIIDSIVKSAKLGKEIEVEIPEI